MNKVAAVIVSYCWLLKTNGLKLTMYLAVHGNAFKLCVPDYKKDVVISLLKTMYQHNYNLVRSTTEPTLKSHFS